MSQQERHGCHRCGSNEVGFWDQIVKLTGGFHAVLCAQCMNEWHVFITAHETFDRALANHDAIQIAMARTCQDGSDRAAEVAALRKSESAINQQLYAIGESWVAEIREPRKRRLRLQLEVMEQEEKG